MATEEVQEITETKIPEALDKNRNDAHIKMYNPIFALFD
jgi:hypothetical protein